MFIIESETNPQRERSITFSPSDFEGVVPHDDDSMVVTLQIFNWDVKKVLIDLGSSADILYYDAFEKIGLDPEQLQPFKGTLAGFTARAVSRSTTYLFENHIWNGRECQNNQSKILSGQCV